MSQRVLTFIRTIIVARFLAPQDFGLMGIALLTLQTLEIFSQTGFQAALVQKKEQVEKYLNTAWTFLALRGVGLLLLTLIVAPYIADFFKSPAAVVLIQCIGVSFFFQGITNIGVIFFQKDLDFKRRFLWEFAGFLVECVVSVVLVIMLKNVWSLVIGKIAGDAAKCIASYLFSAYRPAWDFNREHRRELHRFGRWVFGVNVLVFLTTEGDSVIIGKLFGNTALGFYRMAGRLSYMPTTEIAGVVSQITFPAYARIQDDPAKLKAAFLKTLLATCAVSVLFSGLLFGLAGEFTRLFLGEQWLPIVPVVKILIVAGFIRSIQAIVGPLFQAIGRPKIDTWCQFVRFLSLALLLFPLGSRLNIPGIALAVLCSTAAAVVVSGYYLHKLFGITARDIAAVTWIAVAAGASMLSAIVFGKDFLSLSAHRGINFLMSAAAGILIYAGVFFLLERCCSKVRIRELLRYGRFEYT
ncbi:MAG: lipopolysaccharide biosynthesis protein [Candidatus Omnitrophica bacterium]|nr:lipopolysaccharide biosynthesis protein [Candidatus Omnitrophota bacterium]